MFIETQRLVLNIPKKIQLQLGGLKSRDVVVQHQNIPVPTQKHIDEEVLLLLCAAPRASPPKTHGSCSCLGVGLCRTKPCRVGAWEPSPCGRPGEEVVNSDPKHGVSGVLDGVVKTQKQLKTTA